MPSRSEQRVALGASNGFAGGGSQYLVRTVGGVLYLIYIESTAAAVNFRKSTDNGFTWSAVTQIISGTVISLSIWYDRWSDISGGLIHLAYCDNVSDDVFYRSIDTENSDTLSTQTVIFAGTAASSTGATLSICRSRGGNIYCAFSHSTTEQGFARSTDVGGTWGARTTCMESVTGDWVILVPGWAADNQDMMAFYWDASANEISRKLHDDSADSWAETSIATSMTDDGQTNGFPNFSASVDISNSRNLLVAWSQVDAANADLRCWHVTESAITEVTNVVQNSTDDQGLCAIGIETASGHWYVAYGGKSDGSETWQTALNFYYKISTDSGSTWGSETPLISTAAGILLTARSIRCCPRFVGFFFTDTLYGNDHYVSVPGIQPKATAFIG